MKDGKSIQLFGIDILIALKAKKQTAKAVAFAEKRNDIIRGIYWARCEAIDSNYNTVYKVTSDNEYFDYRNKYPEAVPKEITIRRMAEFHRILPSRKKSHSRKLHIISVILLIWFALAF